MSHLFAFAVLAALSQTSLVSGMALPTLDSLLPRQQNGNGLYDGGSSGSNVNTDAGAAGNSSGSSFSLSTGGLVAIIVVVVAVVIFGVVTTVLWIMAKRRQWDIRASIRHASRRITGRAQDSRVDRRSKRAGVQLDTRPAVRGHKRGLVVEVKDVEKGQSGKGGNSHGMKSQKSTADGSWAHRLLGK